MTKMIRLAIATALIGSVAAPAFADPERRKEERHDERKEERHEERRDERHEERREERHDVRVGPRMAPPAARYERHVERPGQVWVGGRYEYRGDRYEWVGGGYQPQRRGYRWSEPRWEMRDGVYVNVPGEWAIESPRLAPPALREERWETRPGFVYIRGRWDWNGVEWAWQPGHYEGERVGHRWREPRWENRGGVYVRVDGAWE